MSHARKQIRDAVVSLVTGLTTTGKNVFPSRVYSLEDSELPSLSIFMIDVSQDEVVTRVTMANPVRYHRVCPLIIEGHATMAENIDDVLDQIAAEVEAAMSAPLVAGSRILPAQLQTTSKELIADSESQIGLVRLVYSVAYVTAENTPEILE